MIVASKSVIWRPAPPLGNIPTPRRYTLVAMKWFAVFAAAILGFSINTALALDGQGGSTDPFNSDRDATENIMSYSTGNRIPIGESDEADGPGATRGNVLSNLPQVDRHEGYEIRWRKQRNPRLGFLSVAHGSGANTACITPCPGSAHRAGETRGFLTNKTLDPDSPDYKWEDGGQRSLGCRFGDGKEEPACNRPGRLSWRSQ